MSVAVATETRRERLHAGPRPYRIGVIRGDGTGPEVVAEALKVLESVREGFEVELVDFDLGAERYLRTGETHAILLGAVGNPRVPPGILERDLLLRIRFELDQFVNLRPVIRYPGVQTLVPSHTEDDVNMVVVRENSEGLYSGVGGFHRKGTRHEVAVQSSVNTRHGVERIVRYAFELASTRRGKLTLVHKTNVLTYAGDLYQRVAARHPDVAYEERIMDAMAALLVRDAAAFDVIVTDNMFGDIITDLGAMIQGGMGIAAGGNINPDGVSMFEPIGGTAPDQVRGILTGIAAAGVSGVTIKNGSVVNFEAGLHLTGVQNSRVLDTRFSLNSDASAWVEGSSGNKFKRLKMTENGDGGFRLIASSKNRIAGSTVSGASDFGVGLEGLSSYNRLVRNKVTLAGEGIKVEGGTQNRVFRNTTSWNGGAGIEVAEDSVQTRINENQAHHNGGDGIFIEGAGTQLNRNHAGCNGGMGITAPVLVVSGENWAGGNGDNLGCAGVVCRVNLSCGTE